MRYLFRPEPPRRPKWAELLGELLGAAFFAFLFLTPIVIHFHLY